MGRIKKPRQNLIHKKCIGKGMADRQNLYKGLEYFVVYVGATWC